MYMLVWHFHVLNKNIHYLNLIQAGLKMYWATKVLISTVTHLLNCPPSISAFLPHMKVEREVIHKRTCQGEINSLQAFLTFTWEASYLELYHTCMLTHVSGSGWAMISKLAIFPFHYSLQYITHYLQFLYSFHPPLYNYTINVFGDNKRWNTNRGAEQRT